MRKIKARTSGLTRCLPPTRLARESHFQYSRKPARCQATTVFGVTSTSGRFQPDQSFRKITQNSLCTVDSRRRASSAVQSKQLLSQRQVFEKEILAGAEQVNHPADEVPKRGDHSEILSPCRISALCKSFIYRKRKVLMRHS